MPRGSNFYYAGDQQLGAGLGATLGRALFGDPEAAAQLALRKAQAGEYAAQTEEARAHAGLYGSQQADQDVRTGYRRQFGSLGQTFQQIAGAGAPVASAVPDLPPGVAPAPGQPDPLAVQPPAPAVDTNTALARAIIPMIMAAGGTQENPNIGDMVGGVTAMLGNDELARRGMIAGGHTPDKDFALTSGRADQIAQDGYDAAFRKGTAEATINHANDIPVAVANHANDIPVARVNHESDIPVAEIQAGARRDVASLGKTVGFSLVSDVLPGARMTSGERDPGHNADVGGAAHSYHLPGDGVEAFDIQPGTGARNFADAYAAMRAKYGGRLVEAIDETNRPGHGPHWHFAIADAPGGKAAAAKPPKAVSAASNKMLEAELTTQLKNAGMNIDDGAMANIRASVSNDFQRTGNAAESVRNVLQRVRERVASAGAPPVEGAQKAPDGHWYVKRGGQFFRVDAG
jgi:hypothetical protein